MYHLELSVQKAYVLIVQVCDDMDLLELNDIYCKDKVRIKKNKVIQDAIYPKYSFIPTEDKVFSGSKEYPIEAVVNHPFIGACSRSYNHDLQEMANELQVTPVTEWYECTADDPMDYVEYTPEQREEQYARQAVQFLHMHPDIMFVDDLPGLTVAMTLRRDMNNGFKHESIFPGPILVKEYDDGYTFSIDSRPVSLAYIMKSGCILYGYGSMIFFGRGLTSLSYEQKMYLLSSTYLFHKDNGMAMGWNNLVTSGLIIFEDSLERLVDMNEKEKE